MSLTDTKLFTIFQIFDRYFLFINREEEDICFMKFRNCLTFDLFKLFEQNNVVFVFYFRNI